jgi:hypothetical protein
VLARAVGSRYSPRTRRYGPWRDTVHVLTYVDVIRPAPLAQDRVHLRADGRGLVKLSRVGLAPDTRDIGVSRFAVGDLALTR